MNLWHRLIHPLTHRFRRRRGQFILANFPDIRTARICDLGGSIHFWDKLEIDVPRGNITIYNISANETQGMAETTEGGIRVVIYDGVTIPVPDGHYDVLVCNSVLEHVPPAARAALAREIKRVARAVFCQTPAQSFPFEPHFLLPFVHWLPRSWGFRIIQLSPWRLLARPDDATIREYWWGTQLLTGQEVQRLFPDDDIVAERFMGLTKSYYVVRRATPLATRDRLLRAA